ncbi:hypothetical protein J3R30DRAFT_2713122 [Lentinula aciculospora]|uniref:Uncharacterized protein n=1 Tax=Lentinula aciculospora TaxID=153920 RepID=A0A9W9ACV0_9AGAR|nr:hypothetical protein J3R30DRAFT_2713122 [Lentinula aciculospora]
MSDSAQESAFLANAGQLIYWNVSSLIVTCIAYGFNLLAASIAVYLFVKNGVRGIARKALLVLTIIVLLSTTWDVIDRAGLYLTQIDYIFMRPLSGGIIAQAVAANKATIPYEYVDGWPVTINLLIGDGIVSWRAWAIHPHNAIVRALLVILMLANTAVNIADVIMEDVNPSGQSHSLAMDTASVWVSLGVNAFATSMVALKMLQHRRTMRMFFSLKERRTSVEKVLLFLVESGSAFCLFQLLFAIFETLNLYQTSTTDSSIQITTLMLYSIFNGFAVLYPLAVIIMVNVNSSVIEESIIERDSLSPELPNQPPIRKSTKVSTIRFASGPTNSSTTDMELSQRSKDKNEPQSALISTVESIPNV